MTGKAIYNAMSRLYHKAGLTKKRGRMYALRTHSIRKYFRTQHLRLRLELLDAESKQTTV